MRVPRRFVFSKIEVSSAWLTCGSGVCEMGRFNSDKHDVCGRLSGAYFFPPSILY